MMTAFQSCLFLLLTKYGKILLLELLNTLIGQRMLCHLLDYRIWYCCNISSCQSAVCYMDRITDACRNDLCINTVVVKDSGDRLDQIDTRL